MSAHTLGYSHFSLITGYSAGGGGAAVLKAWRCPQRLSPYSSAAAPLVHEESAFLSFWGFFPYSSVPGSKVTPVQGKPQGLQSSLACSR